MTACPSCSAAQPDGARFCFSCGTALAEPTCSSCGTALVPGAQFCSACGAAQVGAAPPAAVPTPVASRRVTSVLFGDLVGFTTLSESRDQEETRELLTRYFDECRRIIDRYGGTVEKFIGDAVMAVWGVPTAHEDDAERAVRAGLELVNAVAAVGADIGLPDLAMRVGIVTGEVAVTIGAEQQGMVAGDAVNTAARVQSVADAGQVWVDETTRLLTSSAISYLDVGSHALKGKADPFPLWSVRAVVAGVGGSQRADGLEAPLVGRERELRLVKELFHAVHESGRPSLLLMLGEPGVGKSRLAWEFEKYVDGLSMSVRWHAGRCVAYGEGLAYFALAEAMRARLRSLAPEADQDDPDPAALDPSHLMELGLDRFVPDADERAWLGPRLGAMLGIGSVGSFPREDLFAAWTVFLERVGEGNPVVLVIDDAHHADDGLLQFIEHLLATGTFPCFVVLLSRPGLLESNPTLATNRSATVSHLPVLGESDMAALLDGLVVGLPDDARGTLVERSEGIPLFAVETVRSLIDRDLVVPRGGQYVLADPDRLDLDSVGAPASLQALVAARLDTLDPEQRRVVDRASVIGNVFSRDDIAELCPEIEDIDAVLDGLLRQQILSRMASKFSAEYGQLQFVQSVIRQVAYGTLSRRDRRATHLAVARQTEAADDAAGELAPIIAQHYLEAIEALPTEPDTAELEALAITHLERAASRARSLGAMTEAANHLLLALEHTQDPATRARLDSAAASALLDKGDYEAAVPHAIAATETFDGMGDPRSAAVAASVHAQALSTTGDNAAAVAIVSPRWDELVERNDADEALQDLGRVLSSAAGRLGQDRTDVYDRRLQIADKLGDREQIAEVLNALGVRYNILGAGEMSAVLASAAADIARSEHIPGVLSRCLLNLNSYYTTTSLPKAIEAGTEAVDVADRAGVAVWKEFALVNLYLALLSSGRWDELEERLDREGTHLAVMIAIEIAIRGFLGAARGEAIDLPWGPDDRPQSDDPLDEGWTLFAEGMAAMSQGRLDEALDRTVASADKFYGASGTADDFVHPWPVAVELAMELGATETLDHLMGVLEDATTRTTVPLSVRAHHRRFLALLARETDPDSVEGMLRQAIAELDEWGSRHYTARAEADLGQWLHQLGRGDEAEPLLSHARSVLTDLGATAWLEQLDRQGATSA